MSPEDFNATFSLLQEDDEELLSTPTQSSPSLLEEVPDTLFPLPLLPPHAQVPSESDILHAVSVANSFLCSPQKPSLTYVNVPFLPTSSSPRSQTQENIWVPTTWKRNFTPIDNCITDCQWKVMDSFNRFVQQNGPVRFACFSLKKGNSLASGYCLGLDWVRRSGPNCLNVFVYVEACSGELPMLSTRLSENNEPVFGWWRDLFVEDMRLVKNTRTVIKQRHIYFQCDTTRRFSTTFKAKHLIKRTYGDFVNLKNWFSGPVTEKSVSSILSSMETFVTERNSKISQMDLIGLSSCPEKVIFFFCNCSVL